MHVFYLSWNILKDHIYYRCSSSRFITNVIPGFSDSLGAEKLLLY